MKHAYLSITSLFNTFYLWIGGFWLFLVMGIPRAYTGLKTILLLIVCIVATLECLLQKNTFKLINLYATGIFVLYFSLSLIYGISNGYPFSHTDFGLVQYFFITPFIALLLGSIFKLHQRWKYIPRLFISMGCLLGILNFAVILNYFGIIPDFYILKFFKIASAENTDVKLAIRVSNDPALMFLMPYLIICLADAFNQSLFKKICIYIGVAMGCLYALLSGRKSLELVIGVSFCVLFLQIWRALDRRTLLKTLFWWILTIIFFVIGVEILSKKISILNIFSSAYETISNGLSPSASGIAKRTGNIDALLSGWLQNPFTFLFGHGLNSYVPESLANWTTKWSYEVFYHAFLYQCGLVGMGILTCSFVLLIKPVWYVYKKLHDSASLAFIVASVCYMFACATNPMIHYIWFWIFLWAFYFQYRQLSRKINED